jgi:type IV pilus assembly protein PilM
MSSNPYLTLLDIRDQRRPLNAYQLLGLSEQEADEEAIRIAVTKRRGVLISRKKDAPPTVWQRLFQELESAASTLTDAERKAAYDARLAAGSGALPSIGGGSKRNGEARSSGGMRSSASSLTLPSVQIIQCPCGMPNPAARKFCGSCGRALREPCVECGTDTFLGEKFCGGCGTNLDESSQRRGERAEVELARARRIVEEGRYQEAEGIVRPLAMLESGRLAEVCSAAKALLGDIVQRRDQSKSNIDTAVNQAIKAINGNRWQEAVDAICSIPALLRTKDHQLLLAQATDAVEELAQLNRDIRAGIQADQTFNLIPKVERVLELDPQNARMPQLLDKLRRRHQHDAQNERKRLMDLARQKLQEFQYQEAADLLQTLPQEASEAEFDEFREHVGEMAFLWSSLRFAPAVEPVLLDLAQRLAKQLPGDPKLKPVVDQLQQRLEQRKARPLEAVPWAKAPAQPPLGFPLKRLGSFGRIDVEEVLTQPVFVASAPRLYVACGLALQGLGQAAIETNLLPKTGSSVIGQLSSWVKRPRSGDAAWGIDLSGSGLKAVKLVRRPKEETVKLAAFDVIEHAAPLCQASETGRRDLLAETLKKFVARNNLKDQIVCVVFPGTQMLGRFFPVPPVEPKRISDLMEYEVRQQVPIPLDQLEWDYHIWYDEGAGEHLSSAAMLVAARQHHIRQRLTLLEDAGVKPSLLQGDAVALYNFYRCALSEANGHECVALLDLGADMTTFVACSRDRVWFRSVPRGSDDFNKSLMRQFEASFATAEQLKHQPAKAKRIGKLHQAWAPAFDVTLKDLRDSLAAYEALDRREKISAILALGGGFQILGLHRHLLGT